jgi:hypothetical protein
VQGSERKKFMMPILSGNVQPYVKPGYMKSISASSAMQGVLFYSVLSILRETAIVMILPNGRSRSNVRTAELEIDWRLSI